MTSSHTNTYMQPPGRTHPEDRIRGHDILASHHLPGADYMLVFRRAGCGHGAVQGLESSNTQGISKGKMATLLEASRGGREGAWGKWLDGNHPKEIANKSPSQTWLTKY